MQPPPGAYQITVRYGDDLAVQDTRTLAEHRTYTLVCEVAEWRRSEVAETCRSLPKPNPVNPVDPVRESKSAW